MTSSTPPPGRVLAIDWGDARVGLALSDPLRITVSPHTTLPRTKHIVKEIAAIVVERGVTAIVVGIPLELDGTAGEQAAKVQTFVEKLKNKLETIPELSALQIILWDERFTTKEAERILAGSKLKNKDRSAALDRISASILLESYLSSVEYQANRAGGTE